MSVPSGPSVVPRLSAKSSRTTVELSGDIGEAGNKPSMQVRAHYLEGPRENGHPGRLGELLGRIADSADMPGELANFRHHCNGCAVNPPSSMSKITESDKPRLPVVAAVDALEFVTMGAHDLDASTDAGTGGRVASDHPGVIDLFAVLAYGEISAFYRLAEDAQMAPDLRGRVAFASMAAAEMDHFETLESALTERGHDIFAVMDPFVRALDNYHASTTPSTWLESLVKAYVGDGIAADFYREIGHSLPDDVAAIVEDVLSQTGHSEFVVLEVKAAVEASSRAKDRLMLWGRRLLGEAITQAQFVLAQREELTDLVISASGDLNGVVALFDGMQAKHAERMEILGLV